MNKRTGIYFLATATLAVVPAWALAQTNSANSEKKGREIRTLTGCLQRGDAAHEYALTAEDGSTWEVKSTTLKLSPHVGHTVTLTGVVSHPELHKMKEDAKDEAKEHGIAKDAKEHGHIRATKLDMISDSCKK
jgi:hypothetical protein